MTEYHYQHLIFLYSKWRWRDPIVNVMTCRINQKWTPWRLSKMGRIYVTFNMPCDYSVPFTQNVPENFSVKHSIWVKQICALFRYSASIKGSWLTVHPKKITILSKQNGRGCDWAESQTFNLFLFCQFQQWTSIFFSQCYCIPIQFRHLQKNLIGWENWVTGMLNRHQVNVSYYSRAWNKNTCSLFCYLWIKQTFFT